MHQVHRVGAEQDELAVGEVEDAHHARDHAETRDHQHDDGAEADDVERDAGDVFHDASPGRPEAFPRRGPQGCTVRASTQAPCAGTAEGRGSRIIPTCAIRMSTGRDDRFR